METIVLRAASLLAVIPFVGNDPTRDALSYIRMEPIVTGGMRLVACDGHRLLAYLDEKAVGLEAPMHIRLPERMMMLKDNPKTKLPLWAVIRPDGDQRPDGLQPVRVSVVEAPSALDALTATALDFRMALASPSIAYPEWKKVLPTEDDLVYANEPPAGPCALFAIDPRLLKDFTQFGKTMTIIPNKNPGSAMMIRWNIDHAVGLLMPMKASTLGYPTWLNEAPA